MSNTDPPGSVTGGFWAEGKERGARRRKLYGYLKAANDIRQSYQEQWAQRPAYNEDEQGIPGAFPDVEVVRNGDEEMVLFPSYARHHVRKRPDHRGLPGANEDLAHPEINGDADYWRREWEKYEDDNAVVDVDVRGWIYAPHRGPLTRKNRLLLAVARRLSGIPAPTASPTASRSSSRHSTYREKLDDTSSLHEEETATQEAQKIVQHGEREARAAQQGGYSEEPTREGMQDESPFDSRPTSPESPREPTPGSIRKALTDSSLSSDVDASQSLKKRRSWLQPDQMSREELKVANENLMTRLRPFMTVPLTNIPITIFFFNDEKSQSRTVYTNDSGHFNVRASLDFVPTHVRVLASDNLSAIGEVQVIATNGVSLISDVDDTIKHSAISSGAKEIFRNTFIRDLSDLTVEGIKEWYSKLYDMGVKFHYVSNSPWQLYPLLRSYFNLAGLPPGSFHLKAYTGMLQGIFEPAAERKRGSLERILRDFPDRKFVLVGDSGEADLEVYTDIVLENPGRVLAIYIRDVTTKEDRQPIDMRPDPASDSASTKRGSDASSIHSKASNAPDERPALPVRSRQALPRQETPKQESGNLIDLDDQPEEPSQRSGSSTSDLALLSDGGKKQPPRRPAKPLSLRSDPNQNEDDTQVRQSAVLSHSTNQSAKKSVPPPPPKPRRQGTQQPSSDPSSQSSQTRAPVSTSVASARDQEMNSSQATGQGFVATAGRQISAAYNALPGSARGQPTRINTTNPADVSSPTPSSTSSTSRPAAPPPRRTLSSYPGLAAQYASNRLSWGSNSNNPPDANPNHHNAATGNTQYPPANPTAQGPAIYSKKEEMWRRRWLRAEDMLRRERIILRTWRVGWEVLEECQKIVERELRDQETVEAKRGKGSERIRERGR